MAKGNNGMKVYFYFLESAAVKRNVSGYVLFVSIVNDSKSSSRKYFKIDLETNNDVEALLCFSPSQNRFFEETTAQHSECMNQKCYNGRR